MQLEHAVNNLCSLQGGCVCNLRLAHCAARGFRGKYFAASYFIQAARSGLLLSLWLSVIGSKPEDAACSPPKNETTVLQEAVYAAETELRELRSKVQREQDDLRHRAATLADAAVRSQAELDRVAKEKAAWAEGQAERARAQAQLQALRQTEEQVKVRLAASAWQLVILIWRGTAAVGQAEVQLRLTLGAQSEEQKHSATESWSAGSSQLATVSGIYNRPVSQRGLC